MTSAVSLHAREVSVSMLRHMGGPDSIRTLSEQRGGHVYALNAANLQLFPLTLDTSLAHADCNVAPTSCHPSDRGQR